MSVTVSRKIAESVIFMLLSLKILRWINSKRHSVRLDWDSENFQNPVFLTDGSNLNLVAFQNPAFVMSPVDPAWLQPDSTTQDAHFQFGDALPGLRTEGTTFSCLGFDPRCRETTIYKRFTSNLAMRSPVSELKEQLFRVWGSIPDVGRLQSTRGSLPIWRCASRSPNWKNKFFMFGDSMPGVGRLRSTTQQAIVINILQPLTL